MVFCFILSIDTLNVKYLYFTPAHFKYGLLTRLSPLPINPTENSDICHWPHFIFINPQYFSRKMTAVQFVWTCKNIYSIPHDFTTQLVPPQPPTIPSPLHFWGRWAVSVSQSCPIAHSFMSDTELSHCEQFLCGLMLTNELSSASSEKSPQSVNVSRRSEALCVLFCEERETTRERQQGFKLFAQLSATLINIKMTGQLCSRL